MLSNFEDGWPRWQHWTKAWAKWQQLSGVRPSIARGPSDCRGPVRLLRARQIAGAPHCWRPLRLLEAPQVDRAHQIVGGHSNCWGLSDWWAPQIDGALQSVVVPSDCWGPLRLQGAPRIAGTPQIAGGLLRLIGSLRLSGTLQIAEGPSDCWGPPDCWGPLCIAQPAQPIATPLRASFNDIITLEHIRWMDSRDF